VNFMDRHSRAFWEVLHWFVMKIKPKKGEVYPDDIIYQGSAKLHKERAQLHENVGRKFGRHVQKLVDEGLPDTIVYEPGFWMYPVKVCYLYLMDPSTQKTTSKGKRRSYTLRDQINLAERDEPCRPDHVDQVLHGRRAHGACPVRGPGESLESGRASREPDPVSDQVRDRSACTSTDGSGRSGHHAFS